VTPPFKPPSECPVCGAAVPPAARACPECGADERTGWREEDALYDGLDLPDSDSTPERSTDRRPGSTRNGTPILWWAVGVVVILTLAILALRSAF
jgi:hypothetical protein